MTKFNMMDLLNNNSKDNFVNKNEKSKKFKTVLINIEDLIPCSDNFYSVEDDEINDLKNSIEVFGLQQNLVVKQLEENQYKIIAGHRRHLALKKLVIEGKAEFKYAPCKVEIEEDQIKDKLLLLITNSTARQLTDWEKIQQSEKLRELLLEYKKQEKLTGRVREIIADILNTSSTQVARMESISKNLTEEFKKELKEDNVNFSSAYEVSKLPIEKQSEVYEEYKEKGNVTIKDVKRKTEEVKKQTVSDSDTINKNDLQIINVNTGELVQQKVPNYLNKKMIDFIQELNTDEFAKFLCERCTGLCGGNGCAGLCDLAIECNGINKHDICMKWLNQQI